MRLSAIVFLALLSLLAERPAAAGETTVGQPICTEKDDLQEFVVALIKKDMVWLKAMKNCTLLKGGLKIETIEDLPSDSDIGHVAKVRVFTDGESFAGYTLIIDGK